MNDTNSNNSNSNNTQSGINAWLSVNVTIVVGATVAAVTGATLLLAGPQAVKNFLLGSQPPPIKIDIKNTNTNTNNNATPAIPPPPVKNVIKNVHGDGIINQGGTINIGTPPSEVRH